MINKKHTPSVFTAQKLRRLGGAIALAVGLVLLLLMLPILAGTPVGPAATGGWQLPLQPGLVRAAGSLTITKSGPATANPDDLITYTLVVSNNGGDTLENFDVYDYIPDDTSCVSVDNGTSGWNTNDATCNADGFASWTSRSQPVGYTMLSGEAETLAFTVQLSAGLVCDQAIITNSSYSAIAYSTVDGSPTFASGPAFTTIVDAPAWGISKSVTPTTAAPGDIVTYTIVVSNSGHYTVGLSSAADSFNIVDYFPLGISPTVIYSASSRADITPTATANYITFISSGPATVGVGESITLTFSVAISDPLTGLGSSGEIVNDNYQVYGSDVCTGATGTLTAPVTVAVPVTLTVNKYDYADPFGVLFDSQLLTYTIMLTAEGSAADGVVFTDIIPTGSYVAYHSASFADGTVDDSNPPTLTFTASNPLAAGDQLSATVVLSITKPVTDGEVIANYIEASAEGGAVVVTSTHNTDMGAGFIEETTLEVLTASMVVTKEAIWDRQPDPLEAGEVISYVYYIENTGNITLTTVEQAEDYYNVTPLGLHGPVDLSAQVSVPITPGAVISFTDSWAPNSSEINAILNSTSEGYLSNTVTIVLTGSYGASGLFDFSVQQTDWATVPVTNTFHISLTKTVYPDTDVQPGDTVTYTYTITNTSLENLQFSGGPGGYLDDSHLADLTTLSWPATFFLGANGSRTFQATRLITYSDLSVLTITNWATATGESVLSGVMATGYDTATITLSRTLGIDVMKVYTVAASVPVEVGEDITFTLYLTNTGQITLDVEISDPFLSYAPASFQLGPEETWEQTLVHTVVADDAPMITNTVAVTGSDAGGVFTSETVTDTDSVTVPVVSGAAITFSKTTDKSIYGVGETVYYTFSFTNTGTVPLTYYVSDPMFPEGDWTMFGERGPLASGANEEFTVWHTVTITDIPQITNTATLTAETGPPLNETLGPYSESVTVTIEYTAQLRLTKKTVPEVLAAQPGDVISYTFEVENLGPVPLDNIQVEDPILGYTSLTFSNLPVDPPNNGVQFPLAGNLTRTLTAGDFDPVTGLFVNVATATAVAYPGESYSQTVIVSDRYTISQGSVFEISKEASPASGSVVEPGDTILYTLALTNTGPSDVGNVSLVDTLPDSGIVMGTISASPSLSWTVSGNVVTFDAGTMAVSDMVTAAIQVAVTGSVSGTELINEATMSGDGSTAGPVSTTHTISSSVPLPSLMKEADPTSGSTVQIGDTITYTIYLMNTMTGTVTITDSFPTGQSYQAGSFVYQPSSVIVSAPAPGSSSNRLIMRGLLEPGYYTFTYVVDVISQSGVISGTIIDNTAVGSVNGTLFGSDTTTHTYNTIVEQPTDTTLYLPLIMVPAAPPDLVVENVTAASGNVIIVIKNQGGPMTLPTPEGYGGFYVDFYGFDPAMAPAASEIIEDYTWAYFYNQPQYDATNMIGKSWFVTEALGSDESLILTVGGPYYQADPTLSMAGAVPTGWTIYAQVDSADNRSDAGSAGGDGVIVESNETNNVGGPGVASASNRAVAPPPSVSSTGLPENAPPRDLKE